MKYSNSHSKKFYNNNCECDTNLPHYQYLHNSIRMSYGNNIDGHCFISK